MAFLGPGHRRAFAHGTRHLLVARHLPFDGDRLGRHAAALERIGGEARPDDEAVRHRIAGRDAERERVPGELRPRARRARGRRGQPAGRGERSRAGQELTPPDRLPTPRTRVHAPNHSRIGRAEHRSTASWAEARAIEPELRSRARYRRSDDSTTC